MAGAVAARLCELAIDLPTPPAPAGHYVPYTIAGNLVFVAGQLPLADGKLRYSGKLGQGGVSIEEGQGAARLCALNVLAQLQVACGGDLDRVRRCLSLRGFVACDGEFTDHPKVINGASELMVAVLGDAGRHARAG